MYTGNLEYPYSSDELAWADEYIAGNVLRRLKADGSIKRVLEAGCGNGNMSARLAKCGFEVCAFDTSISGVEYARGAVADVRFEVASGYDDLLVLFRHEFDACVCIEVIEHLFDPRRFVSRISDVMKPGGLFIVSTPYHGYFKNLALAIAGRADSHYSPLWDGGHIKFWSRSTLSTLLEETGFKIVGFEGAGRLPLFWKSMILSARKPYR